jgi:hypothetical protein
MPFRKSPARSGFQVAFEARGAVGIGEFDGGQQPSWSITHRVPGLPGIVGLDAFRDITGQADIVTPWNGNALEDVDEA